MSLIRIVVAEDHKMFRQAVVAELEHYNIKTIAQAGTGTELLELLTLSQPDVLLLDIQMPCMDGEDALEIITETYPEIKVIVVSMFEENELIIQLLGSGAHAFIPKNLGIETLVDAIRKVKKYGYYYDNIPESIIKLKLENANDSARNKLSKRQTQIIPMICEGKTNKEIADQLNIVIKTVEAHRKIIYDKTNSTSAVELYRYAVRHRIIKN